MPSVLIPPSPQDRKSSPADVDFIQAIVTKILSGSEVTNQELDDLNKAIQTSHKTSIPLVNRDYIDTCTCTCASNSNSNSNSNSPTLVRYIGMVQDMLDPEYYVTHINGASTKYREHYHDDSSQIDSTEIAMNQLLDERQPLLIVPIPHSTGILKKYLATGGACTSLKNEEGQGREQIHIMEQEAADTIFGRKRSLEIMHSTHSTGDGDETDSYSYSYQKKMCMEQSLGTDNDKTGGPAKNNTINDCDWWPRGCMNSQEEDCPILAKIYYQEEDDGSSSRSQRRLQLNDIVEVYGILSLNPLGTSSEHQPKNSQTSTSDGADFNAQQEDYFHDFMDHTVPPPPSVLPRLHVLRYDTLDLDEMMMQEGTEKESEPQAVYTDGERQLAIDTFANHIFGGDKIAAEALLMTLMSLAERDTRYGNKAIQMPSGETLGCGSMNFILSDPQSCVSLQNKLDALMKLIAPVAAKMNLSLSALNVGDSAPAKLNHNAITAPTKTAANRLEPSVLQLPKSSCIVINQGALSEGTLNPSGQRTLEALAKMTRTHSIPYRFDGLMEIDFEADLRIIVLSCNDSCDGGSKLLPCSMSMKMKPRNANAMDVPFVDTIPVETILRIRRYLMTCRYQSSEQTSISLPIDLLEMAQTDFINRRKNSRSSASRDIEESDFHKWLLLTRLQARSRIGEKNFTSTKMSSMAKIEDWENALRLDDALQASFNL